MDSPLGDAAPPPLRLLDRARPAPFAESPSWSRLIYLREELEREVVYQARVWRDTRDPRDMGRLEGALDALGLLIRACEPAPW